MEKTTETLINKIFYDPHANQVFKIMFYDNEDNVFVCKLLNSIIKSYGAYSAKKLEECFFTFEEYEEYKYNFYMENQFFIDFKLLKEDALFMKNLRGICEGLNNIKYIEKLNGYQKEVRKFEKGIRRNKKIIYRYLKGEDYEKFEAHLTSNFLTNVYSLQGQFERICNMAKKVKKSLDDAYIA